MKIKKIAKRLLLLLSVILVWGLCAQKVNPLFVPDPKVVFTNLIEMISKQDLLRQKTKQIKK